MAGTVKKKIKEIEFLAEKLRRELGILNLRVDIVKLKVRKAELKPSKKAKSK